MESKDVTSETEKSVSLSAWLTGASGVVLMVAPDFWKGLLMLPQDAYPGIVVLLGLSLFVNACLLNLVQNEGKR